MQPEMGRGSRGENTNLNYIDNLTHPVPQYWCVRVYRSLWHCVCVFNKENRFSPFVFIRAEEIKATLIDLVFSAHMYAYYFVN